MVTFVVTTQQWLTMGKNTNFSGQPILNQLIMFLDKGKIRKITKENDSDRYVKKFSTYNHVVVMLFVAFEGYHSLREVVLGLLANANKTLPFGFFLYCSPFNILRSQPTA